MNKWVFFKCSQDLNLFWWINVFCKTCIFAGLVNESSWQWWSALWWWLSSSCSWWHACAERGSMPRSIRNKWRSRWKESAWQIWWVLNCDSNNNVGWGCVMGFVLFWVHYITLLFIRHCGLVESVCTWDGTGCEFDSWQCRIYIISHVQRAYDYLGPGSLAGYIWLDTKIVF